MYYRKFHSAFEFLKFISSLLPQTVWSMDRQVDTNYPSLLKYEYLCTGLKVFIGIDNILTRLIYRKFYKCNTDGSFLQPCRKKGPNIINSCMD